MKNKENKETEEVQNHNLYNDDFLFGFTQAIGQLRMGELTPEIIAAYGELPITYIRQLVGENLTEASMALARVQPEAAEVLFKLGSEYLMANKKDFEIKKDMEDMLNADEELRKLYESLVTSPDKEDSNEVKD